MFKTSLEKIIEGKEVKELNTILQCFLLTYQTTSYCQTHTSPAELLFNWKLKLTCLNFAKPTLTDTIASHKYNFCRFHYYIIRINFGAEKIWCNWHKMAKTAKLNLHQIEFFLPAPNLIIFSLCQIKSMAKKKIFNKKIEICFHTVNLLNQVFSL